MSTEPPPSDEPPEPDHPPPAVQPELCEIVLQNRGRFREAGARRHRPWLEGVVAELAPVAESLAVRFVGDREMRRLNGEFRGRPQTTDVLSFPGSEATWIDVPPEKRCGHLGDIAISVPVARRQAEELGHGVERELRILLLHGLLHCLGYDHECDDGTMERLEGRLRRRWIDADG